MSAPLPLDKLFPTLEGRYPGIGKKVLQSCAVTINLEYVDIAKDMSSTTSNEEATSPRDGLMIQPGDEVALIPPVSSG